jgi:hypothetical protein
MLIVLFGTGAQQGELRVVDWTCPSIGSVFIDLATLVHVAPTDLQGELIERYRVELQQDWCQEAWLAAQAHVHLSILQWMVDALRSGQGHTVCRNKMEELLRSLHQYVATD